MSESLATDVSPLEPAQIEHYLQQNPEFFHQHLALLENLNIPHPSGTAVSLISKQLEIFRTKHLELESQLNTLIDIAKENDTLLSRMHELTLALMESQCIDSLVSNLDKVFSDCFLTDFSTIRVIRDSADLSLSDIFVSSDDNNLRHFQRELSTNIPQCGKPTLAQARFLFADNALEVKSCVIIPMSFTELEGVIAIGSRDKNRFNHSLGHLFLIQMSEIIGTRLIALLD